MYRPSNPRVQMEGRVRTLCCDGVVGCLSDAVGRVRTGIRRREKKRIEGLLSVEDDELGGLVDLRVRAFHKLPMSRGQR